MRSLIEAITPYRELQATAKDILINRLELLNSSMKLTRIIFQGLVHIDHLLTSGSMTVMCII